VDELPEEVRRLLRLEQREAAIELLRLRQRLSEEEAARRIELYLEDNPPIHPRGPAILLASKLNALIWLVLIALTALLALIFGG
jgi:hypothetical protein